jgi:hypothetical protein
MLCYLNHVEVLPKTTLSCLQFYFWSANCNISFVFFLDQFSMNLCDCFTPGTLGSIVTELVIIITWYIDYFYNISVYYNHWMRRYFLIQRCNKFDFPSRHRHFNLLKCNLKSRWMLDKWCLFSPPKYNLSQIFFALVMFSFREIRHHSK